MGEPHKKIIEQYAPASALVREDGEIVHLSENANRFLRLGGGKTSFRLLNVAPPGLRSDLQIVLLEAKQTKQPSHSRLASIDMEGKKTFVRLTARPVASNNGDDDLYLVVFDDSPLMADGKKNSSQKSESDDTKVVISRLQRELEESDRRWQAKVEQYEVTAEELNSVNEELRLANQDSEESRQEITIVNEHLRAAGDALHERNEQLLHTKSVLLNLINSMDIGTIFLDRDLKIKQFTPRINEFFNLREADIGRALEHLTNELDYENLMVDAESVLQTLQPIEREVRSVSNQDFIARFLPYRTTVNRIDGVVLTFIDITERKRAEKNLTFLAEISKDLVRLTNAREMMQTVGAKIGAFLNLSNCSFMEIDEAADEAVVTHDWHRPDMLSLVGSYRISDFVTGEFQRASRAGEIFVVRDTQTDSRVDSQRYDLINVRAFLSVPLVSGRLWRFLLVTFDSNSRDWRKGEIELMGELTTRIWTRLERARAEAVLLESEKRLERQSRIFDTTLSSITDFAYIFDKEGRFLYSNKPLLDLLGITLEEIVGKNFFDLNYPEALAARLQSQIRQVFDTSEMVRGETPFTNPAGANGFYEYIFSPVIAEGGAVELVAGSTRDVTMRRSAEESIRFQAHLLDTVEQAVIATDLDGTIIYWNRYAEYLYGWTAAEAVGRNVMELITPNIMQEQAAGIMSELGQGKSWAGEFTVQRQGGAKFPAQVVNSPINDDTGKLIGIVGVSFDITQRQRSEQILHESEERLRLIISSVEDYAIITTDLNGIVNGWNPGAEKIFGYTEQEITGKSADLIFTPEDRKQGIPAKEMQTAIELGSAEDELWQVRRDGSRFFADGIMHPLRDSKITGFVKLVRDMTERLKTEQISRDKEMLQKLVGAQEDERKRIARDLHDELGQLLTGLRFKLESARHLCEDNDELCGKIDETQLLAKRVDNGIDFLAWELRPAALDDLGLRAALEKYVREWSHYSGVTAELLASNFKKTRLASAAETNLYRIAQESLNNVHKHAEAKVVEVSLGKRGVDLIVLIISDNGVGFDPKSKMNRGKGIGLIGMRERAALIGGTIEIESAPGKGTTVFVRVPISTTEMEEADDE